LPGGLYEGKKAFFAAGDGPSFLLLQGLALRWARLKAGNGCFCIESDGTVAVCGKDVKTIIDLVTNPHKKGDEK